MRKMLNYQDLTYKELQQLDRAKTIFLMSVSPIEVHGDHLPTGTDIYVSEELINRYEKELACKYPSYTLVKLPPLYAGANALPVEGSLSIPANTLEKLLISYCKGLSKQGFKYLFIADNHGGPGHQMAMEVVTRKMYRKHKFYFINPFNLEFKYMVQHDPSFLESIGLGPKTCGDDHDSHGGTNETSLMLASAPGKIKPNYIEVETSIPPSVTGGPKVIQTVASILAKLGAKELPRDLTHLANTLAWVSDPKMKSYMGDPKIASKDAGERMLNGRVKVAMDLFEKALRGEEIATTPMLWSVRVLRNLPE